MSTKLTCPDCGGVVGPPEPGMPSCNCFTNDSFVQAQASEAQTPDSGLDQSGFAQPTIEQSLSDTHPVETLTKVCCKCGTDVAGKKRYKDSRGYMCADCNRAEIAAEKDGTALCAECSRRVKETALVEFRGVRICKLCIAELRDADKKRIKVISGKTFEAQDRKTLKILIVIMIILAGFMVLSYFKSRG